MKQIKKLLKQISKLLSFLEYHMLWPLVFSIYKIFTKQDKKCVLFADSYSSNLTDNMRPIYAALENMGGFKLLTCFPSNTKSEKLSTRIERSKTYLHFLKLYAQCGTLFLTESYLPAYAVHARHGTNVVQLWHGCGAFKKWGYSTLNKSFGADKETALQFPMHNCYTLVPISSATCAEHYSDAFRCKPSIVKPLGVPRTDIYFDMDFVSSAKAQLYQSCAKIKGTYSKEDFLSKTLVLYAPTFRGETISDAVSAPLPNFSNFKDGNTIFVCRLHPFARKNAKVSEGIIDISSVPVDISLCAADILITDYSSIIFEYSLTGRPMIFYAYDIDSYERERGFYEPYSSFVPGSIAKTENELTEELYDTVRNIVTTKTNENKKSKEFANKYMSACDGHATERIINELYNKPQWG